MSAYTTGEIAKLCGVTVRTVQYYDTRGILVPNELSEGGRRLYSEDSVRRLKIICFLRELGLSIDSISQLFHEEDPTSVISLLLEQQEKALKEEVAERQEQLQKLECLQREVKNTEHFSVDSIGDIAHSMTNKAKLKKVHRTMILAGIPLNVLQWISVLLWIFRGFWWLFVLWAVIDIIATVLIIRYYCRNVAYICPQCHEVFKPTKKEMMFSKHTPTARQLTCTHCGHHGFCVEIYGGKEQK